ncbi:MAG: helix-turn-helix domain-containing protein [Planctomycetes bacterium]|nr:helix-turn-helix domain-containing protein [Planctomycetota bacterium]
MGGVKRGTFPNFYKSIILVPNKLYYDLHMQIIFLQCNFFRVYYFLIPEVFNFIKAQSLSQNSMITAKEIRELREKLGATQGEFAKALGISFSTISRWENDLAHPDDTQEEQLLALKQLIESKEVEIDRKKLKKMLTLMGIGGVIAIAIAAGVSISNPLGAAISSFIGRNKTVHGLLNLFKKNKKE